MTFQINSFNDLDNFSLGLCFSWNWYFPVQVTDGIVKCRIIFLSTIQPTLELWKYLSHPASNTTVFLGKCDWTRKEIKLLRNYDPINKTLLHPLKFRALFWIETLACIYGLKSNEIPLTCEIFKKIWYKSTYLQNRKRLTDLEKELITRGEG